MVEEPESVIADTPHVPAHSMPTPAFAAEAPVAGEPVAREEVITEEAITNEAITEEVASNEQPPSQSPEQELAPEDDVPSVDSLQGRLADLQAAMDQLQSGDLDGAEATIASLEESLSDARQEHGLT